MSKAREVFRTLFAGREPDESERSIPMDMIQTYVDDGFLTNLVRSGVNVNEHTAMRLGAVFACVRNISQDFASTPLHLYKRSGDKVKKAENHPLYRLLNEAPNKETTAFNFKQSAMANLLLWGDAYIYKERNALGEVIALYNLRSSDVNATRNEAGEIVYYIGSKAYTRYDILHIPGLGFDGVKGRSAIQFAREPIAIGLAAEELGARFFGSGAHLGGVISVKGELSDAAFTRTQKQFNDMYKGLENATGIPILEDGAQFTNTTMPLKDVQYIESRQFSRNEIAMMFRMPPHKIGDLERATFSNIEEQDADYYKSCLMPWFICFEQAIDLQLLKDGEFYEKTPYYSKFNADAFLRASTEDRYAAYSEGINAMWLTVNEVRAKEGLDPLDGEEYDKPIKPLNMANNGGDPQQSELKDKKVEPEPEPGDDGDDDDKKKRSADMEEPVVNELFEERRRLQGMYSGKLRSMMLADLGKDEKAILELAKKKHGQELKDAVIEYFGTRYEEVSSGYQSIISPMSGMVLASAVAETGKSGVSFDNPRFSKFVKSYCDSYAKGYIASTKRMVLNAIDAAVTGARELPSETSEEWDYLDYEDYESILEAFEEERGDNGRKVDQGSRDEMNKAFNALLVMSYILLGIKKKVWVGVGSSCPMCQQLIGKVVEVEKSFTEPGSVLEWTDDMGRVQTMVTTYRSNPPLHKGCDCQVQAV